MVQIGRHQGLVVVGEYPLECSIGRRFDRRVDFLHRRNEWYS